MTIEAWIGLVALAVLLIMAAAIGETLGKKQEGKRWAKAADKSLIEFGHKLYEVTTRKLDKPIDYDK